MPHPSYALIACDVFIEELKTLAGDPPPWQASVYLEMGLHDRPDELRTEIEAEIRNVEAESAGIQAVVLAYGRCGNGLVGVRAQSCPLILPQAHDCISILMGSREKHNALLKENPATYFYSPGWVRGKRVPGPDREAYLRELYAERYEDDQEMIDDLIEADRDAFAHHNCAAYVSVIDHPQAREYCRNCAKHLGWEHKAVPGDPSFLQDLITGNWGNERFLTVPPGHRIDADSSGQLIAVA